MLAMGHTLSFYSCACLTDWQPATAGNACVKALCSSCRPGGCPGAFGEIARDAPAAVAGLGQVLSRAVGKELRSESSSNRRNAAFACGTLLQAAAAEMAASLTSLLQVRTALNTRHWRAMIMACHDVRARHKCIHSTQFMGLEGV